MLVRMSFSITIFIFLAGLICFFMFGCTGSSEEKSTLQMAAPAMKRTTGLPSGKIAVRLLAQTTPSKSSQSDVHLMTVGTFHGDEVSARSGEVWLGLYPTKTGYELIPSRINVETFYDPLYDADDEKTGKKVSVDGPTSPIFMVKGLKILKRGRVQTLFAGKIRMAPGDARSFIYNNAEYDLAAYGEVYTDSMGFTLLRRYKLELSTERKSQVILSYRSTDYAIPGLLWAGDIDRDGKLDLLIDATNHYNVYSAPTLFLSSQVKDGGLLRQVAMFFAVGC